MPDNIFICKECEKSFDSKFKFVAHLHNTHKISPQQYWDKWFGKHYCDCGNETQFIGISAGYRQYCCCKCAQNSKEVQEKHDITCIKKYGVAKPQILEKTKEKAKTTCNERYGGDSFICSLPKEQQTINGKKSWTAEVIEQRKETCIKKYGVDSIGKSLDIRKIAQNTLFNNYGVLYNMQSKYIRDKSKKRYFYNDIKFDSSWELAYYIYLKDHNIEFEYQPEGIKYIFNNEEHYYYPDFKLNNQLVEIKGDHFFDKNGNFIYPYSDNINMQEQYKAKYQCMLDNNVKIMKYNEIRNIMYYIDKIYGKGYLKQFKENKRL